MNPSSPRAEAIAIQNDRIVKVGKEEKIRKWIGKDTEIIDLEGKTVIPAFIDAHVHVGDFGKSLIWIDLRGVTSIKSMQKKIKKRAQETPDGQWILGRGWDQTRFTDNRYPNIQDLDEASPENPVILYHQSERVCIVNSKALEMAGVTRKTTPPSNGTIQKDKKTGELTGLLRGKATDLVWNIIPELDEERLMESAKLACKKILEAGVSTVHWIISSLTELRIIQRLRTKNNLPLRVYPIIPRKILTQIEDLNSYSDRGNNSSRAEAVKFSVDGFLAERTAALCDPYSDDRTTKGKLLHSPKEINKLIFKGHKKHPQLVVHAMGDQAVDITLTAFEESLKKLPKKDHRYRIEQASVLTPQLIQRIKDLNLIISVQPPVISSEFSVWSAVDRLGPERARWLYPLKTLIKEGIRVIGGSDCPMEPINPLLGIQAAVTRKFFPEERVTVKEAIQMYTVNAAYASFEENIKGSIEKGKLADLTVLSKSPLATPRDKIRNIDVRMTIIGGKIVYSKSPS